MTKKFIASQKLPIKIEQVPILKCIQDYGIVCQQEVADLVMKDKSSVHRTVANLSKKGLITILTDPHDKRRNLLTLTDYGKDIVVKIHKDRHM